MKLDWFHLGETGASDHQSDALEFLGLERYLWEKRYPFALPSGGVAWLDGTVTIRRAPNPQNGTTVQAPLDHPNLETAAIMIDDVWPEMGAQLRRILQSIDVFVSTSTRSFPLQVGCSCGPSGDRVSMEIQTTINGAIGMLEGVVHELGHNKLKFFGVCLFHWERLFVNEAPSLERINAGAWIDGEVGRSNDPLLYLSPIRKDKPRPRYFLATLTTSRRLASVRCRWDLSASALMRLK